MRVRPIIVQFFWGVWVRVSVWGALYFDKSLPDNCSIIDTFNIHLAIRG